MKIVFLDIDGVIISAGACIGRRGIFQNRKLMPYCATQVALLKAFCEKTGAKIVINSTHGSSLNETWKWWFTRKLPDTMMWSLMSSYSFWERLYWFFKSKVPTPNIVQALVKAGIPKDMFHKDVRTRYPNGERLKSIGWWLDEHPEIDHGDWVAFDDINLLSYFGDLDPYEQETFGIEDSAKQFVLINPAVGLDIDSVNNTLEHWGYQPWIVCL